MSHLAFSLCMLLVCFPGSMQKKHQTRSIIGMFGDAYIITIRHDDFQGDVNHDGEVNIADVSDLIDYLLNGTWD